MFRKLGMIVFFMVIAFHAINMVIEQQIEGGMLEEMLVGPTDRLGVGHVACLAMLLLYVTPWGVTVVMDLGIEPKIVGISEDNPWEMGQPEEPMSHGGEQPVDKVAVRRHQLQSRERHECGWKRHDDCMIDVETMVVMWTTKLEVLSDLKHLGSMEEPKGESE